MNETQQDKILEAELSAARTETVAISEADFADSMRMAEEVGKVKMARSMASNLNLSIIRWFESMKAGKNYKGRFFINPNGGTFKPETFEELCEGLGFSRQSIDEQLQNLATLGSQYYEESQNLGLKVRDLRKVRKALKDAPEEQRDELFIALREVKDSPEELRTALDVLCSKYLVEKKNNDKLLKENEEIREHWNDLKETYRAQGKVLEAKNQQYDELNEKFIKATSPVPADVLATREAFQENARKMLDEACLAAVDAVNRMGFIAENIMNDGSTSVETARYVHERVSQAVAAMGDLLRMRTEVDFMAEFKVDFGPDEEAAE